MIYAIILIVSAISTLVTAKITDKSWVSYFIIPPVLCLGIYVYDYIQVGYMDPFVPLAMIFLSLVTIGGIFIGQIIWIFYCFENNKNITHIDEL